MTVGKLPTSCRFASFALLLVAIVLFATQSGCVRRRMTIRSNPPGARVYIDNQEIGVTPVSTAYTYYGTREVRLERDGYETLTVSQNFHPPWYEIPPVDFFSETLWPRELRDERVLDFELVPQQIVPTAQLLERAEGLRAQAQQGHAIPLPATLPAMSPLPPTTLPPTSLPAGPPPPRSFGPFGP